MTTSRVYIAGAWTFPCIHNGWGALIDRLEKAAIAAGTMILRGKRVVAVDRVDGRATGVTFADAGTSVGSAAARMASNGRVSSFSIERRVSHAVVTARSRRLAGRPTGRIANLPNVFLGGDWVGPAGQLADAAVARGLEAVRRVAQLLRADGGSHASR